MAASQEQIERQLERSRKMVERGKLLKQDICPQCGKSIKLLQIGGDVYTHPCNHYRWRGRLS